MTFLEAQRAARRGGHRLVDPGRTPNGLYRMLVCTRCGALLSSHNRNVCGRLISLWARLRLDETSVSH